LLLIFYGADTDTDTDSPITAAVLTPDMRYFLVFARKSRVSDVRLYRRVGRDGVGAVSIFSEVHFAESQEVIMNYEL